MVIPFYRLTKYYMEKRLKENYERSLVEGNEERAVLTGRLYYHLRKEGKKQKSNITDIDNKIIEEFRAFNLLP